MNIKKITKLAELFVKQSQSVLHSSALSYADQYLQTVMNSSNEYPKSHFEYTYEMSESPPVGDGSPPVLNIFIRPEHFYTNSGEWYAPSKMQEGITDHVNQMLPGLNVSVMSPLINQQQLVKPELAGAAAKAPQEIDLKPLDEAHQRAEEDRKKSESII